MARIPASSLTVFTVNATSAVCHANDVTYTSNVETEDGSCINEASEEPVAMARMRTISGSGLVDDYPLFISLIESADPTVAFVLNTGAASYSGNALLSTASHGVSRRQLQTQSFELKVIGTPTVTVND